MSTVEVRSPDGRSAHAVIGWSRALVEPALRAAVDTLPGSMRRIAGYHFGWWDEQGEPDTADGGKAIRPALVLSAAGVAGGTGDRAVPAAVAIELVHNFSLLHDDVMDGDRTRRHRSTAWTVFGVGPAILAGDALLTLAFDVLASSEHPVAAPRMLSAAVLDLQDGQASDVAFETRADVELAECVRMAQGKTAALLGGACGLGALFGGGTAEQVEHLRAFGAHVGLAFQLVDDLLGIWGDPSVTGKPAHSDLGNRKKSLPVVAALTSGTPEGRDLAELYGTDTALTPAELTRAAGLVEAAGGREWTRARAERDLTRALSELDAATPHADASEQLIALANLIVHRDY